MTIDEAIKDFEKEWSDFTWTIRRHAYVDGFFQGKDKCRIEVIHPLNSSFGCYKFVICDKDNIAAGFLKMKQLLEEANLQWHKQRKDYGYE